MSENKTYWDKWIFFFKRKITTSQHGKEKGWCKKGKKPLKYGLENYKLKIADEENEFEKERKEDWRKKEEVTQRYYRNHAENSLNITLKLLKV